MIISEVCKKYEITADTLRYYEKIGLLRDVPRSQNGQRDYDDLSCAIVEFVKCMRSAGLSIESLTEYMNLFYEGDSTIAKRKEVLIKQRDLLEARLKDEMKALERLNYKIDNYETFNEKKRGN